MDWRVRDDAVRRADLVGKPRFLVEIRLRIDAIRPSQRVGGRDRSRAKPNGEEVLVMRPSFSDPRVPARCPIQAFARSRIELAHDTLSVLGQVTEPAIQVL